MDASDHIKSRGAVMLELIWVLPVFFALTGLVIWSSLELHAKTAIRSALFSGLRLAAARGNKKDIGGAVIDGVDTYLESGSENSRIRDLLMSSDIESTVPANGIRSLYRRMALLPVFEGQGQAGIGLGSLRREYTFALVYAYAEIRSHLGGLVKYPCDPRNDGGANCLRCQFLNPRPDSFNLDPYEYDNEIPLQELPFLAVRCSYLPADPISKALAPMLGQGASFWPVIVWDGFTSIYRHGYLDEDGDLGFQELG